MRTCSKSYLLETLQPRAQSSAGGFRAEKRLHRVQSTLAGVNYFFRRQVQLSPVTTRFADHVTHPEHRLLIPWAS